MKFESYWPFKLLSTETNVNNLKIPAPPSSISIDGYAHNSKVEVRENQDLTITCTVANSKPPAQIQWYRGNLELKTDNREDKTIEVAGKRFTVTSKLHIKPTTNDDYMEYSCQAKHKALQPDSPMKATIQVSVLCELFNTYNVL